MLSIADISLHGSEMTPCVPLLADMFSNVRKGQGHAWEHQG